MRYLVGAGRFWYEFVVGDDWRIAAGVTAILAVGAVLVSQTGLGDHAITLGCGAAIVLLVTASIVAPALAARRS